MGNENLPKKEDKAASSKAQHDNGWCDLFIDHVIQFAPASIPSWPPIAVKRVA